MIIIYLHERKAEVYSEINSTAMPMNNVSSSSDNL